MAQHLGDCVLQVREEGGEGGLVVAVLQVYTHQTGPLRVEWLLGYGAGSRNTFWNLDFAIKHRILAC